MRVQPFLLDAVSAAASSAFDIDFVVDGIRHHYGFEATQEGFIAEWLYSFPNERRQLLFDRDRSEFSFGRALRGQNKVISALTRPNSLFLSTATQNGHEYLTRASHFFRSLRIDTSSSKNLNMRRLAQSGLDPRTIDFLKRIGTGVVGHRMDEVEVPDDSRQFMKEFRLLLNKHLSGFELDDDAEKLYDLRLAHEAHDRNEVYLRVDDESAGTRRLLALLKDVFSVLDEGGVLVSDELDASLHTQACEALLALFCAPTSNPKGAQLIATTHDTNLLRSPVLRRDQVWFTEKDPRGATILFPLTDLRTRKGDNLEKGYLDGRYGAIPFSGSISELFSAA